MFSHSLTTLAPEVHRGLHGRIHITLGRGAPALVGSREEMRRMAEQILICVGIPEPLIEGDIHSSNDDIHPREKHA